MNNGEQKNKFRLPISAYITYLLLATVLLTGVTFSKYTTKSTSIDEARVAKFNVSLAGDSSVEIEAGKTITKSYTIKNLSDVAVNYTVVATSVPDGVSITYSKETGKLSAGGGTTVNVIFDATNVMEQINKTIDLDILAEQID